MKGQFGFGGLLLFVSTCCAIHVSVPLTPPNNSSPRLAPAPVGVSFEFFAWPGYNDLASTAQCLQNLRDTTGVWPPVRIGGTTGDRASFDLSQVEPVNYYVSKPADAPVSVTFGPSFLSLAGEYQGNVTLGLNRRLNNLTNTRTAATHAVALVTNLKAIELGNEPNFFNKTDPIANGSWTAVKDVASQISWQRQIGNATGRSSIFSAGVYFGVSSFNISRLASQENDQLATVRDFCSHNYPQGSGSFNLSKLMNHPANIKQVSPFKPEYAAASSKGKQYVMGETNSATQGGGGVSPTFGAALWIVDYVMQAVILGVSELYFHQGTIGNCQYCWWGNVSMGSPYYGAFFVSEALAGATQVAQIDNGLTNYAAYAIFDGTEPTKVLLYNSDYFSGNGTRTNQTFCLNGLASSSVTAVRLTAKSAESRQDQGQKPTVGGQTFEDGTCTVQGDRVLETVEVDYGQADFSLRASEALLIYL